MKIHALFSLVMAAFLSNAMAQTLATHTEDSSAAPKKVFAKNTLATVEPVAVDKNDEAEPRTEVYFNESFNSETSQDAIIDHVTKVLLKDPDHACEIVKQAIVVTEADEKLVMRIVEAACMAAPEKMRLIAQCAMAASPDSLQGIQQILAKLDPGAGDSSISGKEVTGKETIDEKGGKPVPPAAPVFDPLRRAYIPPTPPLIIVNPATNNNLRRK